MPTDEIDRISSHSRRRKPKKSKIRKFLQKRGGWERFPASLGIDKREVRSDACEENPTATGQGWQASDNCNCQRLSVIETNTETSNVGENTHDQKVPDSK